MNDLRKTTGALRQGLKAAVRRALMLAGGGDSVQHATRVKSPALSRYASSHEEHQDNHCPVDVALDLDLEAGQPIILTAMAKAQGYELLPVGLIGSSDIPWVAKLGMIQRVGGEIGGLIGDALTDNVMDAEEAKCIVEKIDEHIDQMRRLKARVEAEGGQGGSIVRMTGSAR